MAKLRMAHASTHGARKPPGPKKKHNATAASFAAENILNICDYFREGSEALSNFAHVHQMSVP